MKRILSILILLNLFGLTALRLWPPRPDSRQHGKAFAVLPFNEEFVVLGNGLQRLTLEGFGLQKECHGCHGTSWCSNSETELVSGGLCCVCCKTLMARDALLINSY